MVSIRASVAIVVLVLAIGVALLIGRIFAENPREDGLAWKLLGYSFLSSCTFSLNGVPVPLGHVIALHLAARCRVNAGARRASATAAFLIWMIGLLVEPPQPGPFRYG